MEVDLKRDGLLWLINRSVFHPRGFALAVKDGEFSLLGNGTEVWSFAVVDEQAKFDAAESTFIRAAEMNLAD